MKVFVCENKIHSSFSHCSQCSDLVEVQFIINKKTF